MLSTPSSAAEGGDDESRVALVGVGRDESALWCVGVITGLGTWALTVAQIRQVASVCFDAPEAPIGPRLAEHLGAVKARSTCESSS